MLKALLFLWFCACSLLGSAQTWHAHLDSAKAEAAANEQPILLLFSGSDWCAGCIMLKRDVFDRAAFKAFAGDNVVLANADFPQRKKHKPVELIAHHDQLAALYNAKGQFPVLVLLDKNGNELQRKEGYAKESADEFIRLIEEMIAKSKAVETSK